MGDFIINIINFIISIFGKTLTFVLSVLPSSPFSSLNSFSSSISEYLGSLGWLIPFSSIILLLQTWTSAILIYYVYQIVMRYIKVIS